MNSIQNSENFLAWKSYFLWIFLLSFFFISKAGAQELYLEGHFQKRICFEGKTNDEPTVHFSAKLKANNWQIQYSTWREDYDYAEGQYHGTNVTLVVFIGSGVNAQIKKGVAMAPNLALGTIYRGEVPNLEDADDLGVIWLAYISGSYFKKQTNNFVEPMFYQDPNSAMRFGPPNHFKTEALWSLASTEIPFVNNLVYLSDGKAMSVNGEYQKRPAPYDKGFTNAYYQVESFQNIDGLSVPARSNLKIFRTMSDADSNSDLDLLFEYHISLEKAGRHVPEMPTEQWLPITAVRDFRIKTDSPDKFACYYATNSFPTDQEALNMRVSNGKLNRDIRAAHKLFMKGVLKIVLLFILLLPMLVMVYQSMRPGKFTQPDS